MDIGESRKNRASKLDEYLAYFLHLGSRGKGKSIRISILSTQIESSRSLELAYYNMECQIGLEKVGRREAGK